MKLLRQTKIQLLIIILLTSLAYLNIFQNNFAADDTDFITGWEAIRHIKNIPEILTTQSTHPEHQGVYRPLRSLILLLAYQLFGTNPFGYHLLSLVVHLTSTILIFFITFQIMPGIMNHESRIKGKKQKTNPINDNSNFSIPFFSALFFGLHPVHTEAITFMTNSFDSIGLVFFLGSFYLYMKAKFKAAIVLAALAFFTYEMSLTLPVVILLYDFLFKKKTVSHRLKMYFPYFLLLALYLFIRVFIFNIYTRGQYIGGYFYFNLLIMVKVFIKYLTLLIWPLNLSLNHSIGEGVFALSDKSSISPENFKSLTAFNPQISLGLLIIFGLIILTIKFRKKVPILSFALAWFFITLLPVSNLLPQGEILSERYLYLPSFGFVLILALGIARAARFIAKLTRTSNSKLQAFSFSLAFLIFSFSLLTFYGIRTYLRNQDWKDNLTVWTVLARQNPDDFKANYNLADLYANGGNYDESVKYFNRALDLNNKLYLAHYRLGQIYQIQGNFELAKDEFRKAIGINPGFALAVSAVSGISQRYNSKQGVSFYYPKGWKVNEQEDKVVIKDSNSEFSVELKRIQPENGQTVEQYAAGSKLRDDEGVLKNRGLAKIPNFEEAFVNVYELNQKPKLQFFLFGKGKIVQVIVFPADSPLMSKFDEIVGSIKIE